MGEDWKRKTQKAYRRLLRKGQEQLDPAPLFVSPEVEIRRYPCQLVDPDCSVPVGRRLTILRHSENARIAILDGNRIVGLVPGDAAKDLKRLLDDHKQGAPCALPVEVASVTGETVHFEVKPITTISRKKGPKG
jgi:hypothetical protein